MKERGNRLLKKLDVFAGIPIVFILGLLKKIFGRKVNCSPDNKKTLTIGVLKEAAIGDLVVLSGVLKDIEKWAPEAKLILCCSKENFALTNLLDLNLNVEVVVLPMSKPLELFKRVLSLPEMDLWMDFGQWPRINAIISFLVKAKCKLGFKTPGQFRHYVYDIAISHSGDRHEIENYREFLRALKIPAGSLPALKIIPKSIELSKKFVIFHMFPGGARSYLRVWDKRYWMELGRFFLERNYAIALTGGKMDFQEAEEFKIELEGFNISNSIVINGAGKWSLEETVFAISKAVLVVSVATSIVHLAAAINANLIGLYGPTSSERWGPLGKKSRVISPLLDCSPCLNLGFESRCKDNKCMKMIKVEDVIKAAKSLVPDL